jgi:hypothetical protein
MAGVISPLFITGRCVIATVTAPGMPDCGGVIAVGIGGITSDAPIGGTAATAVAQYVIATVAGALRACVRRRTVFALGGNEVAYLEGV